MPCCAVLRERYADLQVKAERAALDQMRAEFESELQQARGEMQRAQDALQGKSTMSAFWYNMCKCRLCLVGPLMPLEHHMHAANFFLGTL